MEFMKKVFQHLRQLPAVGRMLKEDGLINTTDLLVATGATVILASAVGGAALSVLDDAKYGKAQPDAQAISSALSSFYSDTGKWPGQAEHTADTSKPMFLVTTGVTQSNIGFLPDNLTLASPQTGKAVEVVASATCQNNSLEGFVGKTIGTGDLATATRKNINDFLLRKPADAAYPNWQGPYIQAEITTDPWDRAWVLNLMPLYCSEDVTTGGGTDTAGNLGYAWLLAGGTNRTISTSVRSARLDQTGDDAGINLGKVVVRGTGGADAGL